VSTVQEVIDRITACEKERAYLLAVLDLWVKAQDQGIDSDTVRGFGFDSRLLTPVQRRRQFVPTQPGVNQYIEVLRTGRRRPRLFNYVWHHDDSQTILNPMLKAVYEHDE